MSRARHAAMALLVGAVLLPVPSVWASPSPSPSPSPVGSPTFSPAPSKDAAVREVQRQKRALATETAELQAAAAAATRTLQEYQEAQRAAQAATTASIAESVRATSAARRTDAARRELHEYAGSLYRTGMVDARLLIFTAALTSEEPQQLFGSLGVARRVGTTRANALTGLADAQAQLGAAAHASDVAAAAAERATRRASAAKAAASSVVVTYTRLIAARRAALARSVSTLAYAELRENNLTKALAVARERGWMPQAAVDGANAQKGGPCVGHDVSGFGNGEIPLEALCPLWGVRGHRLRADAAAGFNAMAREYAAHFGSPLCVTDSYRGFDAQVAVAIEKPDLAATPGQSNHGWGLATDLCDGVQDFATPQHQWLVENSMQFGWFLPPWADETGSKPEPWHWEYAG